MSFYEKHKEAILKYQKSDKGKASHKKAQDKYDRTEKGKLSNRKRTKEYSKSNNKKIKAQSKLARLFKYGDTSNSDFICAICEKQPIEKHHENYDLWYSFIPLCKSCHIETYVGE